MPRARLMQPDGGTTEWKSEALCAYQRRTRAAEALIAGDATLNSNQSRDHETGRSTTPSGTTPSRTSRHRAISSLRASATIIVLRLCGAFFVRA